MRITLLHLGFAEYTMGLANALAAHVEVTVVHPESLAPLCASLAVPSLHLRSFHRPERRRDLGNLLAIPRALKLIEESKPDILHVQEMFDYAYDLYSMFARLPRMVTTIHDVVPHPGDGHAAPGLAYTKAVSCWRSQRLIVHTEGMRRQLASRFRVDARKIDVIPHGELGSLYQELAAKAGVAVALREPNTLLFFGRIWPYKGLRYLLEAFALVKRAIPDARLIIAGRGGDLEANSQLLSKLEGVEVLNSYIPAKDVAGLFERSSVAVLPYIEASQSGVSAVAFTTGTVVVASRVGGLADLIRDGETGILVEPRDSPALASCLIGVLKDVELQAHVRKNAEILGRTTLRWDNIAASTMLTYRTALSSPT